MMRASLVFSAGLIFAVGCQPTAGDVPYESTEVEQQAVPHYLVQDTTLRIFPTDAERVSDPTSDSDMRNWKGELRRGQTMLVEKRQNGWVQVRLDGEANGWLPEDLLIKREGLSEMAVLQDAVGLIAPGGEPAAEAPTVERGSLVLTSSETNGFVLANVGAGPAVWLERGKLSAEESDVALAHIIVKAKWSTRHHNIANNSRLLDKARIKHPNSKLMDLVADQVPFQDFSETPHLGTSEMEREDEARQGLNVVKAASPLPAPVAVPESRTK
ncbi:MAG: hypothetical protein VX834_00190 [Myxococcota bacterium]|nr:hypothetical protein [Myxococcota bacterium]